MHATSDIEACYDRQMIEVCVLVEESIGDNRKVVKLLTKVLPIFEHHVGTANGVSSKKHGRANELL